MLWIIYYMTIKAETIERLGKSFFMMYLKFVTKYREILFIIRTLVLFQRLIENTYLFKYIFILIFDYLFVFNIYIFIYVNNYLSM